MNILFQVDAAALYNTLINHYQKEPEASVRVKLINILSQMMQSNLIEASVLFEDLQPFLKTEPSHKVLAVFLSTFHRIKKIERDDKLLLHIFVLAKKVSYNLIFQFTFILLKILLCVFELKLF